MYVFHMYIASSWNTTVLVSYCLSTLVDVSSHFKIHFPLLILKSLYVARIVSEFLNLVVWEILFIFVIAYLIQFLKMSNSMSSFKAPTWCKFFLENKQLQ
jgi:hypothetical protein